ncbi:MAG: sulfatase-like hydrolase/transferase, partial [Armatimonadia bacterium]|nr:sulfatase-like hydrolase/transferase [Armatimonadia bacterium]
MLWRGSRSTSSSGKPSSALGMSHVRLSRCWATTSEPMLVVGVDFLELPASTCRPRERPSSTTREPPHHRVKPSGGRFMSERRMDRRGFLQHATALSAVAAIGQMARAQGRRRPNIIFMMSDDHASHALSCYGSVINETPQLDRIADEGVRFDNCFCTNSICAPSRAVILTGKFSHENGVLDNRLEFDGSQLTFPK